jgi:hypothetical protein
VLQKLGPCSAAFVAASCSQLSHAIPAHTRKVAVHCSNSAVFQSFVSWLEHHRDRLTSLECCSIAGDICAYQPSTQSLQLPYQQLQELFLENVQVQFGSAGGFAGVLQGCTCLRVLDMYRCKVQDPHAASAVSRPSQHCQDSSAWVCRGWKMHTGATYSCIRCRTA